MQERPGAGIVAPMLTGLPEIFIFIIRISLLEGLAFDRCVKHAKVGLNILMVSRFLSSGRLIKWDSIAVMQFLHPGL